jgi:hypothetical protein
MRRLVVLKLVSVAYITEAQWNLERPLRWHNSFDSFAEEHYYNMFRFEKRDMVRLKRALRIPAEVKTANRLSFSGEEVLLRSLHEMVSGSDQADIARDVFGRDQPAQSQV